MQLTVTDDFDRRRDRAPPMVTVFQSLEPTESLMAVTAWATGDWERTGSPPKWGCANKRYIELSATCSAVVFSGYQAKG